MIEHAYSVLLECSVVQYRTLELRAGRYWELNLVAHKTGTRIILGPGGLTCMEGDSRATCDGLCECEEVR